MRRVVCLFLALLTCLGYSSPAMLGASPSLSIARQNQVFAPKGFRRLDPANPADRAVVADYYDLTVVADVEHDALAMNFGKQIPFPSPVQSLSVLQASYFVTNPSYASVSGAIAAATAAGGTIYLPAGTISMTSAAGATSLVATSGVNLIGVPMQILASGTSGTPDTAWAISGGTQFVGDGTFPCIAANLTGTPPAVFNTIQVGHAAFKNLSFSNFTDGIEIGGPQLCGPAYCDFDDIYVSHCNWAIELINLLHCHIRHVYTQASLNGIHLAAYAAHSGQQGLQGGNSDITSCYFTAPLVASGYVGIQSRAYLLDATNSGTSAILNEIKIYDCQENNYTRTKISETTATSSASGLTAASPADVASLLPGMLMFCDTPSTSGLTTGIEYVLLTVNYSTGLMTWGNQFTGSAVTMTASSANVAWHTWGFAGITILGGTIGDSTSRVNNVHIGGQDAEGCGAFLYCENCVAVIVSDVLDLPASRDHDLVLRFCQNSEFHFLSTGLTDVDSNSNTSAFWGHMKPSQRTGTGIAFNANTPGDNAYELWLNSSTPDIQSKADGGNWMYPNTGLGMRVSAFSTGVTLSSNSSGINIYNSASSGTATLGAIVNSGNANTWNIGAVHVITVNGAGSLKVGVTSSQPFQDTASGNLFCTITQGGSLWVVAASTAGNATGGTLYWVVVSAINCTFSASDLGGPVWLVVIFGACAGRLRRRRRK